MRILLYPLILVAGIYAVLFVPYDILVGSLGLGMRETRGVCLFGAPNCEAYWRSVGSFSVIAYVSMLVIALVALQLRAKRPDTSDDHDSE
ncbi:hypothetical protein SAMN04488568_11245 [Maricaulis salignorans]|uniref:Uncharacterized protein n=1 Tax=Maricaulis salignorans TaxID=144026 RepID=A0A1G9TLC6_9PROT|nr:hypothetical protein SAMN04488568_11245 [Maricaulis salignorans]